MRIGEKLFPLSCLREAGKEVQHPQTGTTGVLNLHTLPMQEQRALQAAADKLLEGSPAWGLHHLMLASEIWDFSSCHLEEIQMQGAPAAMSIKEAQDGKYSGNSSYHPLTAA